MATKLLNQITSFAAFVATIYSASIINATIVNYKVAFQPITLPFKVNIYLVRDLLFKYLK